MHFMEGRQIHVKIYIFVYNFRIAFMFKIFMLTEKMIKHHARMHS